MSTISYAQAQSLTVQYLQDWLAKLPAARRSAPAIMFDMRSWSVQEMLNQVRMNTAVGQRYVNYYIGSLKNYVIQ